MGEFGSVCYAMLLLALSSCSLLGGGSGLLGSEALMAQQRSHMMPVHFAPHHHDTARHARRTGLVLMRGSLPQEVEEVVSKFKKVYPRAQIQTLLTKLKQVYGTESLAI